MLQYPSILGWRLTPKFINEPCYAFVKYDGSNLRWEWSQKQGWYKYGTRNILFDATTPIYNQAIELFQDQLGPDIMERVHDAYGKKVERVVAFTEFFGAQSFAGLHEPGDSMELRLFDVSLFKKGFMSPEDFNKVFTGLPFCAETIYAGRYSYDFIEQIRQNRFNLNEGVVCKGGSGHGIWRSKVKTLAYMQRLREAYPHLWELDKDQQ